MKTVFFLVVLANLMLFLWEYHKNVDQPKDDWYVVAAPSEREAILLASERPKDQKDTVENEKNQTVSASSSKFVNDEDAVDQTIRETSLTSSKTDDIEIFQAGEKDSRQCYQAGPFTSGDVIKIWRTRLKASGAQTKFISREEKIINDYVVYYPAADKIEETEANVQMLKSHGLSEFWIKRTGDEKGQILLGIFSREEKAIKMKNKLQAEGINAELKSRYQNKVNRYALIRADDHALPGLDDLKRTYPAIPVNLLDRRWESCLVDSIDNGQVSVKTAAEALIKESGGLASTAVKAEPDKPAYSGREPKDSQVPAKTSGDLNLGETCYKVGPFKDEKLLQAWIKQLAADDVEINPLTFEEKIVSDFLVYYPAAKTPEQLAANLQMLKNTGVKDMWVIGTGDDKGKISLGVFTQQQRAGVLKKHLRAKGVYAEIKPRYKTKRLKYLVVNGGSKLKDSLKALEKNYPGPFVKPVQNCEMSKGGN